MNIRNLLNIALFISILQSSIQITDAKQLKLSSPDGRLQTVIDDNEGLTFSISLSGKSIMRESSIGLVTYDGINLQKEGKISGGKSIFHKETISSPFYRQRSISVSYNEMNISLGKGFGIIMRAYNEGVAYRFYTTRKGETIIIDECANYTFKPESKSWLSYTTNEKDPYAMAFQNIYDATEISKAKKGIAFLPATVQCDGAKVTILESDIASYPGMFVKAQDAGILKADFAPYPKNMEYYPWRHMTHVTERENFICKSTGARTYPWRIFAVTEKDTEMPVNNLVYALASPNKIGDTAWIKPGKVAWDWWNDWNLKGVDFKAGINFETYKYYIDFAAKHNIEYIVLDEGWYDSKSGDILHPIDDIRLPELIAYGKQKGVNIVLWAVFNVMDENLETICKHYADMDIKGFKVDFMDRNDQTAAEMVERLAACCAKNHLFLDLHGIYTPVGLNRTYPNVLNYESVFGMEESRWTDIETHDMPLYDVTFPYIRMMSGQVDFTPGAMRNANQQDWKAIYRKPMSMGTRCHQAACYIIHDSPFTMLADTPTNYEEDETYTCFIATVPLVFDETIIPQGEIGKYIVTTRRINGDWYIAGQTNWDERDVTLAFNFLTQGTNYKAQILKDGVNANHDAEDYSLTETTINSETSLPIHMAQGGGFLIKLTEVKKQ